MSVIFIGLETDPENNYPDPQLCFNQCQYPQHCLCLCVQEFPDSDERGGAVRGGAGQQAHHSRRRGGPGIEGVTRSGKGGGGITRSGRVGSPGQV